MPGHDHHACQHSYSRFLVEVLLTWVTQTSTLNLASPAPQPLAWEHWLRGCSVVGHENASACPQDALLGNQSAATTRAVFAPKVTGALRLASRGAQLPMRCPYASTFVTQRI